METILSSLMHFETLPSVLEI